MYVVEGNPLEDITNTRNVKLVMKSGQVYDPQKLLEQMKGNIGPESATEVNRWLEYSELKEGIRLSVITYKIRDNES